MSTEGTRKVKSIEGVLSAKVPSEFPCLVCQGWNSSERRFAGLG